MATNQHREIELEATRSRLLVDFQTTGDDPAQLNQPGCAKLLQLGPGRVKLPGIPLKIAAAAGSSVRLKYMPASAAMEGRQQGGYSSRL